MNFDENGRRISPHEILKNKQIYLRSPMRSDLCHGTCVHFQVSKFNFREAKVRCHICDIFIRIQGTKDSVGRICSCCGVQLGRTISQVEKYGKNGVVNDKMGDDFWTEKNKKKNQFNNSESEKRDISVGVEEFDESKKTYSELKEFIEEGMKLQANYQLVMLDELVSNDTRHKGQIAEAIAFWNNKDPSDLEVLKYYMDVIPVYDVLIKRGFVRYASDYNSPISPVFTLNVDLEEFQQARIQELITERLEQWNKEHGIPDNEFPNADTKNNVIWTAKWRKVPEVTQPSTLERPEGVSVGSKYWIWSVTEENWDKVVQKKVWGSKADVENIEKYVQKGDKIIFYVKGTNQFKGIMKLSSDWQDDSRNLRWTDEIQEQEVIYNSFVELKQVVLGVADIDLLENLEIFKEKPREQRGLVLKGTGGGYPANNCRPIPDRDYEEIKQLLKDNPGTGKSQNQLYRTRDQTESNSQKEEMISKECPSCGYTIRGIGYSKNFEDKLEYYFGYRQMNSEDPGSRKPQSYCRKCRRNGKTSEIQSQQVTNYVLLRHKADRNPYRDNLDAGYYNYPKIANYTKLYPGTETIWFDKIDGEYYFWGYGTISEITQHNNNSIRGGTEFEAKFEEFHYFSENETSKNVNGKYLKKSTDAITTDIKQSHSFNEQSSIVPIDEHLFNAIINSRKFDYRKNHLTKSEITNKIVKISNQMKKLQNELDGLTKRLEDENES
tara:strand:- start:591 stop:2753 length:2163 start_codon:yes stop_codon:yes gene_type:complete